ncbi:OCA5 [Candida pseudojiufengensis]|uniref:OCA5 n=1 Tax=Candida pseudojiufengensis TaxID=497109 RepID=UPI00222517C8|nr:OCA5 [Candida pseudojiufengensis]KAI5961628.1 OCA5 [Candida pseudojiufengensis]
MIESPKASISKISIPSSSSTSISSTIESSKTSTSEFSNDNQDTTVKSNIEPISHHNQDQQIPLEDHKPSFNYDLEIFNLCKEYLSSKNHHGLALVARQKGIPPFLRFKIWPILLKYHPFVLNPFIQPDNEIIDESSSDSELSSISSKKSTISSKSNNDSDVEEVKETDTTKEIEIKIKKDISRYIQRLYYLQNHQITDIEKDIISILENSVLKFAIKWSKIIKYDSSLSWMALNLAEWFPPIPKTSWVLVGRDNHSKGNSLTTNVLDDYSNYIENIPGLQDYLDELIKKDNISNMAFHEVYERLVLVLLHCPEPEQKKEEEETKSKDASSSSSSSQQLKIVNKTTLPIKGGTIEERVSFFIFCLRKLLPELSQYFHEEQILTKFGCSDDEWLIWWLKFVGTKVWSKHDRGRIWDYMMGWRLKNPKRTLNHYYEKLNYVNRNTLEKLGPDVFWTVNAEQDNKHTLDPRRSSFKDLINDLNNDFKDSKNNKTSTNDSSSSSSNSPSPSELESPNLSIPFSKIDPHIALIFISISLLKSKENTLVELDQHEIRQFLSRLPSKSYKYNQKSRKKEHATTEDVNSNNQSNSTSPISSPIDKLPINNIIISNDSRNNKHKINFIDNIIIEAGEMWRKWLWSEFIDDN